MQIYGLILIQDTLRYHQALDTTLLVFLTVLILISSSRNGSRSPRPSVLLPTKAWQAQQEQLGKYDQKRISPTEFDDSDKPKLKYDEFNSS